jgi:hypothetical protein
MQQQAAHTSKLGGNPEVRTLVKQVADLLNKTREEESWLNWLPWHASQTDLEALDQEIDRRWKTIEDLAYRLFNTRPHSLGDAAAQAAVALALSNAGAWDEDPSLTAAARTLAALGPAHRDDPALAAATRKLHNALPYL